MFAGPVVAPSPHDQRRYRRDPIRLEVQYKLLRFGMVKRTGSGRTLNISSHGVLLESEPLLPERGEIVLEREWPFLLDGTRQLKFVVRGRIVRSDGKATAVKFRSYDFRTKRSS